VRSGKYDALILSQLKRLSSFQTIYTLSGHYPKETLTFRCGRLIKSEFSRHLPWLLRRETISASRASKNERGIWQRRYWEHTLRNEADFARHADYIHYNPVKHGYVDQVIDWPHSSFHRFVKLGIYPSDWGGNIASIERGFGES